LDLSNADLSQANLRGANFAETDLSHANLTYSNLSDASLTDAILSDADLSNAVLVDTSFRGAALRGLNLTQTLLWDTVLADCINLADAKGLETVRHSGPSVLDAQTLRASVTRLPDVFLQGVGYTPDEIEYLRALYSKPIQFYSCFLSHGVPNAAFTERLRTDLTAKGISTWHYKYDMKPGELMQKQIGEAIRIKDKLLLVCSKDALSRQPVIDEIIEALIHENEGGVQKLFPIRLDEYIFSDELTKMHAENVAKGVWKPWLERVRAYWIADFTEWKDHDSYQAEFDKLAKALKNQKTAPA
jgi:hypothetical protein